MKKLLALVLVAMLAIAGCTSKGTETKPQTPAAPKDPVKITFWHGMNDDSAHGKVLKQLIEKFNASQKEVIVEATYQGSYGDLEKKLTSAIAAQTPPTVVQNTDSMLSNLVRAKAVQALDTLVPAADKSDYFPSTLVATTFDGKLYGLPFNKSVIVFIYDKTLVKEAPKNWDEFRKIAKEVTIKDKRFGTAFEANVYYFGQFFNQAGGAWLTADGKANFAGPEGQQALQFIVDMAKEGSAIQLKPKEYTSNYFNEGRAAMIVSTSASFAYIKPASGNAWGVAPLFAGPKNDNVPLSGANVSIVSGVKPEEAQAAAKFVLWLTGKDAQVEWGMGKTGYGPVRKSAVETQVWKDFVKANPEYEIVAKSIAKGTVHPSHPQWAAVQQQITTAVETALLGKASAKDALAEAAKQGDVLLQKK